MAAFEQTLVKGGLPLATAKRVVQDGYEDPTHLFDCFEEQSNWLEYLKDLICEQNLADEAVPAENWSRHPIKGKAVALWRDLQKRAPMSALASNTAKGTAAVHTTSLLPGMPKKCDSAERARLEAVFAQRNESFLVTAAINPCDDTFNAVWSQPDQWLPWKKTVSEKEKDWIDLQKSSGNQGAKSQAEILSQAYGLDTATLEDAPGSHNAVRNTLECRMVAVATAESESILPFSTYVSSFMEQYAKRYSPTSGLRGPDKTEGEEADREAWREVLRLRKSGLPWKEALEEVVLVREIFRSRLDGKPKANMLGNSGNSRGSFQRQQPDAGKGSGSKGFQKGFQKKRKGDSKGDNGKGDSKRPKMSFCFAWQEGNCNKGDNCRFLHKCSTCFSKEHGCQDASCPGE